MNKITVLGMSILATIGLFAVSRFNFVLFHTIIEFASVFMSLLALTIAVNHLRKTAHAEQHFYIGLGVLLGGVGCVDFLHLLAYKGMKVLAQDEQSHVVWR